MSDGDVWVMCNVQERKSFQSGEVTRNINVS